jgi:hypothetical protein
MLVLLLDLAGGTAFAQSHIPGPRGPIGPPGPVGPQGPPGPPGNSSGLALETFGGAGDGSTDNSVAFAAAINALSFGGSTVQGGGCILLGPGKFKISTSIDMTGKNGLCIRGQGMQATQIVPAGNFPAFVAHGTYANPTSKISIADLWINYGAGASINGMISGTTLTVNRVTAGTVAVGQIIAGGGVKASTTIVSGSGATWTVSTSQTLVSSDLTLIQPNAHAVEWHYVNTGTVENVFVTGASRAFDIDGAWQVRLTGNRTDGNPGNGADQSDVGLYMRIPSDAADTIHNNGVIATNNIFQSFNSYGLRALQYAGSVFTSNQYMGGAIPVYLCDPGTATYPNGDPVLCEFGFFNGDQVDSPSSYGWYIKKGLASALGSGMTFTQLWAGNTVGAAVYVDGGSGLSFNGADIESTDVAVDLENSTNITLSGYLNNYNRNNNGSPAVKLNNTTGSVVANVVTTSGHPVGTGGVVESGTSSGNSYNANGTLKESGAILTPPAGLNTALSATQILSGSGASGFAANPFTISADTADASSGFLNGWQFVHYFGGSSVKGGRETLASYTYFNGATNASNANRNYVGYAPTVVAQTGDGGTDTASGAKGAFFAFGGQTIACGTDTSASICPAGAATNINNLTYMEVNVGAFAGSSVRYKSGIQIANLSLDAVQGSQYDAALSISTQSNLVGWKNGILFSQANGYAPIASSGTLIATQDSGSIANVIDVSSYSVSDALLKATNIYLHAAGYLETKTSGVVNTSLGGDANGVLLVGPQSGGAGTKAPFIDFHTGSASVDARIQADAANQLSLTVGGTLVSRWTSTGMVVPATFSFTGSGSFTNTTTLSGLSQFGTGSTGSGGSTYMQVSRSADTNGNTLIDSFIAGGGTNTLSLNTLFNNPIATGTGLFTAGGNLTAVGTVRANAGFSANGTAGASATVTVRDSAGTGTCNLVFTSGLYTSTTC